MAVTDMVVIIRDITMTKNDTITLVQKKSYSERLFLKLNILIGLDKELFQDDTLLITKPN